MCHGHEHKACLASSFTCLILSISSAAEKKDSCMCYLSRFDTSKTQRLFANLSDDEKQLFGFDVSDIDWETYIKRIHIPGLRKHVLKGRGSNM